MHGVVIPTITPMNEDGSVDYISLDRMTEYLIEAGVDCLYPNGTNGESLLLSREERQQIAEAMVKKAAHRVPVYIQCGSMTTEETASHVRHAVKIGADGVGIMSPVFFPMDEEAMFRHYSEVLKDVPEEFPVFIYNIPGCTTNDVLPRLLGRLMKSYGNIAGIKYSAPDLMRIENYLSCGERCPKVLIGCDSLFLQCLVTGGVGTVTGPGAVFAERFKRLYRQFLAGDMEGAAVTQRQIVFTDRELEGIPGIPALKTMLKLKGVIRTDRCRGPLRSLTEDEKSVIRQALEQYDREESRA